jgi:regulator of protease activity HflC (stomatin/prohibitin superfamily)
MSAQQNYAKFESRVANDEMIQESMNTYPSSANSYDYEYSYGGDWFVSSLGSTVWNLLQGLGIILLGVVIASVVVYFLYIIISLFAKGGAVTITEMWITLKRLGEKWKQFRAWIWNLLKKIWGWIWGHKTWSLLILLALFLLNFLGNVFQWESQILKLLNIQDGYVGVDLKNEKIYEPGRHLFSPLLSSVFMSVTSVFNFEIAAVTANTKEDMFVELDYRVGFTLDKGQLIPFYKKYGALSVRNVASDVVMPRVLEVLKWIIKEYSFKEISSKNNEIKLRTIEETNKVLNPLGIELNDINVLDIRLPESYTKAIEALENADNALKLATAELETEKKHAEKEIIKAESDKKVQIIKAQGIAEYNTILNSTRMSAEMLELKRIENEHYKLEKWDGKLPNTEGWWRMINVGNTGE